MTKKISIIVPALNAEKTVQKCVESLVNQDIDEYEILIVDNGSSDQTRTVLQKFDGQICVLNESRKGSYRARNKGLSRVNGDIVAFTDSDCVASSNWLKFIIDNFNDPEVKLVGGPVRALFRQSQVQMYCDQFCHVPHKYMFTTSNMAVRKEVLIKAGGFNASLKSGGDLELCSRIIHSPREAIFDARAIVYHAYSDSLRDFIARNYKYGMGISTIQRKLGKNLESAGIGYIEMIKKYGSRFAYYKIIQDISFRIGLLG